MFTTWNEEVDVRGTLYIMVGLPGSLKSTIAKNLANGLAADGALTAIISDDDLRTMLFAGYTFSEDKDAVVDDVMHAAASRLMSGGCDVVIIDAPNLTIADRRSYMDMAGIFQYDTIVVHALGDAHNIDRRMGNPRGFSKEHWEKVTAGMSAKMEIPTPAECRLFSVPVSAKAKE